MKDKEKTKNQGNNSDFNSLPKSKGVPSDVELNGVVEFDNEKSFTFNLPKIKDNGEDADPFCLVEKDYVILAAFDGLGGAGSQPITINQETKSSAYFASRLVKECFNNFFPEKLNLTDSDFDAKIHDLLSIDLRFYLKRKLDDYLVAHKVPQSKIKSSLIKSIPTTLASVFIVKTNEPHFVRCYSFWAGDSRVYRLSTSCGLQQMTEDDLKQKGDAFENLRNDAKMTNFITPDLDFKINVKAFNFQTPSIFFACTDGCFDFLPTPMDFEFMLLKTMQESDTLENWCESIQVTLNSIPTGDDCSLSLWFHGWDSFKSIQTSFADRTLELKSEIAPIEKIREEAKAIKEDIKELDEVIEKYRKEKEIPKNDLSKKEKDILDLSKSIWENYKGNYYTDGDNFENVNS